MKRANHNVDWTELCELLIHLWIYEMLKIYEMLNSTNWQRDLNENYIYIYGVYTIFHMYFTVHMFSDTIRQNKHLY